MQDNLMGPTALVLTLALPQGTHREELDTHPP